MKTFLFLLICLFLPQLLQAQAPPLERTISVNIQNERLNTALDVISRAGDFSFSYNPAILNQNSLITLRLSNSTVRTVLNQLFKGSITFKSRGNHVILLKAEEIIDETPRNIYLEGYVIDRQTGTKISQASIYERTSLASTVSNPYGYYRLKLSGDLQAVRIEVRKQYYFGESMTLPGRRSQTVDIRLAPAPLSTPVRPIPVRKVADTTLTPLATQKPAVVAPPVAVASADTTRKALAFDWKRERDEFMQWAKSQRQKIHDANLSGDTLYRDVQFSLLPFVGTNGTLSGRVINRTSFNIIAGYSLGVTALEVGGFANIVRGNVDGIQAAGFANAVGENVSGVQAAGFINANRRNMTGVQIAGFGNAVGGDANGVQGSGYYNIVVGSMPDGVQGSGFINIVGRDMNGVQATGFMNVVGRDFAGFQIAGFGNVTVRNNDGWQIAGFFNSTAGEQRGPQIAGFLNYARRITKGRQIGFINVSDYAERAPIGFFSYVKENGYRRLEFSTDELFVGNAAFKTGKRGFYNIFTAGTNFGQTDRPSWSFGYGLGTGLRLGRSWTANLEGTSYYVVPEEWRRFDEGGNLIRLSATVEKKLGSRVALAVGPSLNWFFTNPRYGTLPQVRPNFSLFKSGPEISNTLSTGWIGFQAAIRFCNKS